MTKQFLQFCCVAAFAAALASHPAVGAPEADGEAGPAAVRGSLVEDRAARKLLEAGDGRYEVGEVKEALEVWKSVTERYPRSPVRFQAFMRLGNYYLEKDRAYAQARGFFEAVVVEENQDQAQRAEATLKIGICFYESRMFGKCFQVMRDVIEEYPVSPQVNQAYYYIGLGHFQLGHYGRAIDALEKVGTALDGEGGIAEKLEAGKRMFVTIDDADLAALEAGAGVKVRVEASSGDSEEMSCYPVGRNVRVVLGTLPTDLGRPKPHNGTLEINGADTVTVRYIDSHTADRQVDQPVVKEIGVVGNANVRVTDGAYSEPLLGVVLGKPVNVEVTDADRDQSEGADEVGAVVEVLRRKTEEELANDMAADAATNPERGLAAQQQIAAEDHALKSAGEAGGSAGAEEARYKLIGKITLKLVEVKLVKHESEPTAATHTAVPEELPGDQPADSDTAPAPVETNVVDHSIHSGVFRGTVVLMPSESPSLDDEIVHALPGDLLRVTYTDEINSTDGVRQVKAVVRCIEGDLGAPKITKALITDDELRLQTKLKTAAALTNIGNRYKDFGLKTNADEKYEQALAECDGIMTEAAKLGGEVLEETYVQLWRIYFEMDQLDLASAMAYRLQREFPTSGFVDEALLQLGDVARKQGDVQRAISIYSRLARMTTSTLRGEAQFGIAECYEKMAEAATEQSAPPLFDRAFQEYKKVLEQFPDSGRVGEAVSKMANHYYKQKDYARAIDTFESVLSDHPDAKFLDVVLFNYGRCLYRMGNKAGARSKFDQLIGEHPQSPLAADAKKLSDALAKGDG